MNPISAKKTDVSCNVRKNPPPRGSDSIASNDILRCLRVVPPRAPPVSTSQMLGPLPLLFQPPNPGVQQTAPPPHKKSFGRVSFLAIVA
ncbi:hypothetical protein KCP71_11015 [Salmonella enterica subsp. enterica]|nr:hypothetical protein KCP71_11015 [Salmonella enterica subsp. enterica]